MLRQRRAGNKRCGQIRRAGGESYHLQETRKSKSHHLQACVLVWACRQSDSQVRAPAQEGLHREQPTSAIVTRIAMHQGSLRGTYIPDGAWRSAVRTWRHAKYTQINRVNNPHSNSYNYMPSVNRTRKLIPVVPAGHAYRTHRFRQIKPIFPHTVKRGKCFKTTWHNSIVQ